jgi:hypothetical protein
MTKRSRSHSESATPEEVTAIRAAIRQCLSQMDDKGRKIGQAQYGVYCFYDYDDEPIYVGQTRESLQQRISRHLTNQRTDAVAMNVLDPFEVLSIELYPLWDVADPVLSDKEKQAILDNTEYTVYSEAIKKSKYQAILNEGDMRSAQSVGLPQAFKYRIVPDEVYNLRKHPDIRIARRAMTIANLARVISERDVSLGLRRTLLTQAKRLERLSLDRLSEFDLIFPIERDTETGASPIIDDNRNDDNE